MNHYLGEGATRSLGVLYLPSKEMIVSKFADIVAVVESGQNIVENKDFHYVLSHYAYVPFPWKDELASWSTKK